MSEFECVNHHLMSASDRFCPECGGRACYMDGYSSRQLAKMDAEIIEEDEEEDE